MQSNRAILRSDGLSPTPAEAAVAAHTDAIKKMALADYGQGRIFMKTLSVTCAAHTHICTKWC